MLFKHNNIKLNLYQLFECRGFIADRFMLASLANTVCWVGPASQKLQSLIRPLKFKPCRTVIGFDVQKFISYPCIDSHGEVIVSLDASMRLWVHCHEGLRHLRWILWLKAFQHTGMCACVSYLLHNVIYYINFYVLKLLKHMQPALLWTILILSSETYPDS